MRDGELTVGSLNDETNRFEDENMRFRTDAEYLVCSSLCLKEVKKRVKYLERTKKT